MFSKKGNSKNFLLKFNLYLVFIFLLYFISNNLIYAQYQAKSEPKYLIPIGEVIQMDAKYGYVIINGKSNPYPFEYGDFIISVNEMKLNNQKDLLKNINSLNKKNMVIVKIIRKDKEYTFKVNSTIFDEIKISNSISAFATLTYINPENKEFAAMAHSFIENFKYDLPIKDGLIQTVSNLSIRKSVKNDIGHLSGTSNYIIGVFNNCRPYGINGVVNNYDIANLKKYKVANLDEVKIGKAKLILKISGKYNKYDIEINNINYQNSPKDKTFEIKVVDKKLLDLTGGIVQGMSGCPIVQGDKIIGAVSHANGNNPEYGNAVFIKWMFKD